MNYQNLVEEINDYSTYFKYCDSIITKFSLFCKEFAKSGKLFTTKAKKSMKDVYIDINKEKYFSSSLISNLNNFCDEFKEIMDKLESYFTRIEKELVDKITEFEQKYETNNRNNLTKLNELNIYLSESKNKLEKTKTNYFDSCKSFSDYDKKYFSNKQRENMKEEEIARIKEQSEKLKQTSETKKVYYRIEVTKLNDLLLSNESYYSSIISSIEKQEEERNTFYVSIILLFNNIIKEFNFESKESINRNEKYIDEIFIKRDTKMFSLYFNKINNKQKSRFLYEEFLDYENSSASQNNKSGDYNKNDKNNENTINDKEELDKIDFDLASQIIDLGKNSFIDNDTMDDELIELDNIISSLIQRDEKIDSEKFMQIINYIDENPEGCKNFLYLLMGHYCLKNLEKFNNYDNLYLLNSILNMIINFIWENDDYAYLFLLILDIGEKTVYYNSNDTLPTNYLRKIMSKNTIYHNEELWIKIIDLKIKMLAKIKINEEFYSRRKNSISKKKTGLMSKIFWNKGEDNTKIEKEILYSQIYKEKASDYCTEILTEFICHFINYDFIEQKTSKVIELISNQYSLNLKQKNYFLKMIDSNLMYQKICNPYFSDSKSNKKNLIKCDTQEDLDKLYFSFKSNKKFKFLEKNSKSKIFLFAMKYLNNKDIIPLLCLNKEFNSTLKKIVYKNVLIKYSNKIDIKQHLAIWKNILNYNSIKRKYNYKSILDSIQKESNKTNIFDIIVLDTVRTIFFKNQESNQKKLGNILKAASKELPEVNYCQGMNHIAGLLLVLCEENEEEAFYLFLSLLLATDYCSLVINNLKKLNSFFYCFERLLNIMFPEMNRYFKNINVNCGYFLSPWFITLFTNAYNDENGQDNLKIIIRIFDLFILSGWKAIFKIGISLIRKNSLKIISSPYEQLVHYLNNEIIHSDFFKNENLNELMNISINFKLSNKLINNLCEEFEMKTNIMNKINNL